MQSKLLLTKQLKVLKELSNHLKLHFYQGKISFERTLMSPRER
jgi:hypothetical protein